MTTQPDPAPTGQKPARQLVEPLRETAAFVLLGANGVLLFVAVLSLLGEATSATGSFARASAGLFGDFAGLTAIAFPLIAVLLATFIAPTLPKAKLIVTAALVELGVSAFFGVLFGLLIGMAGLLETSILTVFTGLLTRVAWLAVLGLVGYGVWTIFQANYYTPRPKKVAPPPGMYGQPGQPYAGQPYPGQPYPGQQPYQQHPGQQPPYGYPPQQQYGAPYGDPQQQYGAEATSAFPVQQPASGPPAGQQQPYPAPQSGPPQQQPYPSPQSGPPQSGPQSGPPSSSVPPHVQQPPAPQGPPPGYDQVPRNPEDR